MIIIKIVLLLVLLALLLRLKVPFTLTILFIAFLLGITSGLNLGAIGKAGFLTIRKPETVSLIGLVGLILAFSELLSQSGHLASLGKTIACVFGKQRITLLIFPALIGLLPMPGGAFFSAPMVEGLSKEIQTSPHKKTLINYWFRHIWEYAWPLYPGLILAADLSHIPLFTLCSFLAPLYFVSILSGAIFILPGITIRRDSPDPPHTSAIYLRLIYLVLPIGLIIALFLIGHLPLWLCMLISVFWVILDNLLLKKLNLKQILLIIFGTRTVYLMMLMVASVLVFVGILQASNLTGELSGFFRERTGQSLPMLYSIGVIIFFPFIIGLLTGLTMSFVGTTFPIIVSAFIPEGSFNAPFIMLAYTSGLAGVMLSPAHLCLVLTNKYFGSSLAKVYQYLIPIVLIILLSGIGLFLIYLQFS